MHSNVTAANINIAFNQQNCNYEPDRTEETLEEELGLLNTLNKNVPTALMELRIRLETGSFITNNSLYKLGMCVKTDLSDV